MQESAAVNGDIAVMETHIAVPGVEVVHAQEALLLNNKVTLLPVPEAIPDVVQAGMTLRQIVELLALLALTLNVLLVNNVTISSPLPLVEEETLLKITLLKITLLNKVTLHQTPAD